MRRHPWVLGRLVAVCALLVGSGTARAGVLFVDDDATGEEDGSFLHPYDTIAEAVAAAGDPDRFDPNSTVSILVDAGTYDEPQPIVLDRRKLRVVGATGVTWVDGFPGAPTGAAQSVIQWQWIEPAPAPPASTSAATFRVTEDDVHVEGFTFVGPGQAEPRFGRMEAAIEIAGSNVEPERAGDTDTIEGIVVRGCAFLDEAVGVRTTHASATLESNYVANPFIGMLFFAGPAGGGSAVVARFNRIIGSQASGMLAFGQSRTAGIAGELDVEVAFNDLSHNGRKQMTGNNFGAGFQSFVVTDSPVGSRIPVANQSLPAALSVDVHHNVFVENRHYGVALSDRAQGTASSPSTFTATVEHNEFCGNGNNDVIVSTLFFFKALCPGIALPARHASGAEWDITLGPDVAWDYVIDQYTGAENHGPNHVLVNGQELSVPSAAISPWPGLLDYCNPDVPVPDTCEE